MSPSGYTVVIPTRDRYDLLSRALASVARQTVAAEEVLIVDNSPVPRSIDLACFKGSSTEVRVILHPEARNAAEVRNAALQQRRSRYVAFLDDDDEWGPSKMERQLAFLRDHPEFSAVVCGRTVVSGRVTRTELPPAGDLEWLMAYDNFGGSFSFIVYDAERCPEVRLEPQLAAFQDWDFLLRLMAHGRLGVVREPLAVYHDHDAPRITSKVTGRRQSLQHLLLVHRRAMPKDARRWVHSRIAGLRAKEAGLTSQPWSVVCGWVFRSLRLGSFTDFPLLLRVRGLAARAALLLPQNASLRLTRAATQLKAWFSPAPAIKG